MPVAITLVKTWSSNVTLWTVIIKMIFENVNVKKHATALSIEIVCRH